MSQILGQPLSYGQTVTQPASVLGPDEGEHLIHARDHGNVFIKIGNTGSSNLAMGTQQVMKGSGIPIHRHLKWTKPSTFWGAVGSAL